MKILKQIVGLFQRRQETDPRIQMLLEERQMSHHELAGRFIELCQRLETLMKLCIIDKKPHLTVESFGNRMFGSVLEEFVSVYPGESANEWLETIRDFRGEVTHTYFRDLGNIAQQLEEQDLGEAWLRLEHRSLQKGLRHAEASIGMLITLRRWTDEGQQQ